MNLTQTLLAVLLVLALIALGYVTTRYLTMAKIATEYIDEQILREEALRDSLILERDLSAKIREESKLREDSLVALIIPLDSILKTGSYVSYQNYRNTVRAIPSDDTESYIRALSVHFARLDESGFENP